MHAIARTTGYVEACICCSRTSFLGTNLVPHQELKVCSLYFEKVLRPTRSIIKGSMYSLFRTCTSPECIQCSRKRDVNSCSTPDAYFPQMICRCQHIPVAAFDLHLQHSSVRFQRARWISFAFCVHHTMDAMEPALRNPVSSHCSGNSTGW